MITLRALNAAKSADVIIVPRSSEDSQGYAEKFIAALVPDKKYLHVHFPMILDPYERSEHILAQVEALSSQLEDMETIFFPVIGDAMLYSTGEYFLEAMNKTFDDLETEFIPGISAYSLAAALAKRFMAMRDDILTIIPGTAPTSRIMLALEGCECAAIYKPSALLDIEPIVQDFRIANFGHVVRVDYAGIPELEKVIEGDDALRNISEYMSIVLIWRD